LLGRVKPLFHSSASTKRPGSLMDAAKIVLSLKCFAQAGQAINIHRDGRLRVADDPPAGRSLEFLACVSWVVAFASIPHFIFESFSGFTSVCRLHYTCALHLGQF
jgi:hypothetical protein